MPLVLTDQNSPILKDSQSSFIGGQFSNAVPLELDATACALLENTETSMTGRAQMRRGTVQLGGAVGGGGGTISLLDYYKTPTNDYGVAFLSSGGVFKLNGGSWQQLASGTPPTGLVVSSAVGNSYLYAVNGASTIRRWDGTTWTTLSTDSPPANCSILCWDGNRLVASGQDNAPGAIYFSGVLDDTKWATLLGGYQIIPGGDAGLPVTALVPWSGTNLVAFKHNEVWNIGADPLNNVSDMSVRRIHSRVGCIATNSAIQCGADILFLSSDGVRSLQKTLASDDYSQLEPPLSFPVQDIIRRINPAAASKASAVFWQGRYMLSVALDSSSTNNYILIYDTITSKWMGAWTNLPSSFMKVRNDGGTNKLMLGLSTDNKVIEYLDYVLESDATDSTYTDYNGVIVPFHFITRAMIFGDLDSPKKGLNVNMKLYQCKGIISITAIFDEGKLTDTLTIDTGDPAGLRFPITFPGIFARLGVQPASMSLLRYPRFHQVQFELKTITAGRKEVRALTAQAFPEAIDLRGQFVAQRS